MIEVQEGKGGVRFRVRVQPRASKTEITGEWQGALRVRLAAPPVDDRANEELVRFLANVLNVATSAIRITAGHRSRTKHIELHGVTAEHIRTIATSWQSP